MASLITGAEVTLAGRQQWQGPRGWGAWLHHPPGFKWVSWLTSLCSLVLLSAAVLLEWSAGNAAPLFTSLFSMHKLDLRNTRVQKGGRTQNQSNILILVTINYITVQNSRTIDREKQLGRETIAPRQKISNLCPGLAWNVSFSYLFSDSSSFTAAMQLFGLNWQLQDHETYGPFENGGGARDTTPNTFMASPDNSEPLNLKLPLTFTLWSFNKAVKAQWAAYTRRTCELLVLITTDEQISWTQRDVFDVTSCMCFYWLYAVVVDVMFQVSQEKKYIHWLKSLRR